MSEEEAEFQILELRNDHHIIMLAKRWLEKISGRKVRIHNQRIIRNGIRENL